MHISPGHHIKSPGFINSPGDLLGDWATGSSSRLLEPPSKRSLFCLAHSYLELAKVVWGPGRMRSGRGWGLQGSAPPRTNDRPPLTTSPC